MAISIMLLVLKQWLYLIYFWLYFQAWTQKQKRMWSIILLIDNTTFKHNCFLYTHENVFWSLDTVTYLVSLFFMVLFCLFVCFCKSCLQRNHILSQIFRGFSLQIKLNHISVILFHFNSYWYCICKNIKCGLPVFFVFFNLNSTIKKYFSCLHGFTPTEITWLHSASHTSRWVRIQNIYSD